MEPAQIIAGMQALTRERGVTGGIGLENLARVRGGVSSEIWAMDGRWDDGGREQSRPLILRSGAENEFSFAGRDMEYRVLKALGASDIPVPKIYWFDPDGTHFGRQTMVMERSRGTADRMLLTQRNQLGLDAAARVSAAHQIVDLLGQIHNFPIDGSDLASVQIAAEPAADQLAKHDAAIEALELEPMIELRIASWWLWKHLPKPPARRTIVHGDYRPANMLVEDGHVTTVLDWEFVNIGDPMEDLGWYLSPHYAGEHLIAGAFTAEDAIARYEATTGTVVDRAAVRFWSVFAIYKLAYMTTAALRWMAQGDASRMTGSASFILKPLLGAIAKLTRESSEPMDKAVMA